MKLRSPSGTKIVGAVSLLLLLGLGWMFVVGPETGTLSQVRGDIQSTRDQNDNLRVQLAAINQQREQIDETRRTAEALADLFPPTADQPGLFEAVTAAAVDAGIGAEGVTTLAPTPPVIGAVDPATGVQVEQPEGEAALARQSVSVSVDGSYEETQQLLANLEEMPRAYLITSATMAVGERPGSYVTTVMGDMFLMPPVPDEVASVETAPQDSGSGS